MHGKCHYLGMAALPIPPLIVTAILGKAIDINGVEIEPTTDYTDGLVMYVSHHATRIFTHI